VAPEDAVEMDDLRGFTRDLMRRMEQDLDTRLDWIAVDHHNTGHPHTHIIVRGVQGDGRTSTSRATTSPTASAIGRASWSRWNSGRKPRSMSPASWRARWRPSG
jgi:hypothetical protein